MFRNREFRSSCIKIIIFQLVFALFVFLAISLYMEHINKKIVEENMALISIGVEGNRTRENKMIGTLIDGVRQEDVERGREILTPYGYDESLKKNRNMVLNRISPKMEYFFLIFVFLGFIPIICIIYYDYKKIYGKVEEVYMAAEKVVEGDYSVYLAEEGEGDLNILNHQFNQMSKTLENTMDRLEGEKKFLKDMISDISHQLKTPLASLIMITDILSESDNMDEKTKSVFYERMSNQLERMEWLIINLLKLARIEAGTIEFNRDKVYMRDIVNKSIIGVKSLAKNREIEIISNDEAYFFGDEEWTTEAVINILKNALEHSSERVVISIEDNKIGSSINIIDDGSGIRDEDLPYIFKRFYSSNSSVKANSIGIGLSLSKLIIESQNGVIAVSTSESGTEMRISFLKYIV